MRMYRFTSWITESRGSDKAVNGQVDNSMASNTRPVVEIPGAASKRKRSQSETAPDVVLDPSYSAKKLKSDLPLTDGQEVSHQSEVPRPTKKPVDPYLISNAIESQFSLEILLKHNELRLINQELAKCQAALEQLRRCHLIPYPTAQGTPESMVNITNGTGPAISQNASVPRWAPPFGVTDGPYSRHYAKWLIPDPNFDGVQEWQRGMEGSRAGKSLPEGRATRHSFAEGITPISKPRLGRGSTGQKLQSLSSGYPQAKEKAGPCILKRSDGQTVKLVCIDCQRENFSSTQGFINHCRIAHKRDFKSHEEAAVASGQPIEIDELGGIVGEEKSPTVASGLVHPLIRSASTDNDAINAVLSRIKVAQEMISQGRMPGIQSTPTSANTTPSKSNGSFVPSSATPHLSELMRRKGFGGDLQEIVEEAKKHIDFDEVSSHDEDSEDIDGTPQHQKYPMGIDGAGPSPPMRMPARAGISSVPFGRPTSAKGIDGRNGRQAGLSGISPRLSYATPVINTTMNSSARLANVHPVDSAGPTLETDVDMEMMDMPSIVDLSPHTIASNNAPSLVSDDGEYDDHDDVDSGSSEDEDEESDVAEIDIEDDGVDKVVPRTVLRNRTGSGSEAMRLRKEEKEKHVTFVSPVKETGKERRTRRA